MSSKLRHGTINGSIDGKISLGLTPVVDVTNRIGPCRCGCKGSDSWHRKEFQRQVDVVEVRDVVANETDRVRTLVLAVGVARFPAGPCNVELRALSFDGKIYVRGASWTRASL